MDSDTKQRVNDLFDIMEGISTDIDFEKEVLRLNTEIGELKSEIGELKTALSDLSAKYIDLESDYRQKKDNVRLVHESMHAMLAGME